jgi:AcrR family transcriptional regulator
MPTLTSPRRVHPADPLIVLEEAGEARSGRRRGPSATAEQILSAARAEFASHGFASTSLRTVAAAAGVDHALVTYFFKSKDALFRAATRLPIDPNCAAMREFRSSGAPLSERVTRLYFALWTRPEIAQAMSAVILEAGLRSEAAGALRDFMLRSVVRPVARELGLDHEPLRLSLMAGFLASVAIQRHFSPGCALANCSLNQVVGLTEPIVRHILTAPASAPVTRPITTPITIPIDLRPESLTSLPIPEPVA